MRKTIMMLLLLAFSQMVWSQAPLAGDNPGNCHANFMATPESMNPMVFHFQDKSTGLITNWQWSFGDGVTSIDQHPVHSFQAGGTYFVCLTVYNSDSGNICHDVLCVPVTVHEPGACIADYIYTVDNFNPFRIHFIDKSTGNINRWHWDFGDGNFSDDRSPLHTFNGFDKYRVCLTAYNADSISVCQNVKCDTVNVHPPLVCQAKFNAKLDSLNHSPNTFKFVNQSTGEPNDFLWKFDDGATYTSHYVTHQFHKAGDHKVCLYITREEFGNVLCEDSTCQIITTAKYLNLGGHLFIGNYPINNPVSSGDTGIAYLIRKNGSKLIPFDTVRFTQLGYYAFPSVLNGYYIVKATLTKGSANFSKYFPAYFPQELKWKEGDILNLSDTSNFTSHVYLLPIGELNPGPGAIRGKVVKAESDAHSDWISNAEVILYDSQFNPLIFAISGDEGQFEIKNLPYGSYNLYVDYPGKYSRIRAVWLDALSPVDDSLKLELFDHDVTGFADAKGSAFSSSDLFPNPAADAVNLIVHSNVTTPLKFEILTITGLTIYSESRLCQEGSDRITFPVGAIPSGIYLFTVKSQNGVLLAVKKLVK